MENQIETNVVKPKLSLFLNEVEYKLISTESENQLDTGITNIENYMANNHGFDQSEEYKDSLYSRAKELWNQYAGTLREVKYTFYLNKKQFDFLTTLLREKLEYDVHTVFLAIELTNMLGGWIKGVAKHKDEVEIKAFTADATEITYIYHLVAKHKVRGLSKDTYLFAEILKKIGDISKIINYYDTSAKNLSTEIQKWVGSFEPQDDKETTELETEVVSATLAPKKKEKVSE